MRFLVLFALLPLVAHAAPPPGADPNSPMAAWFKGLQQPHPGISCCSVADCRPVNARVIDGHYQVLHEGKWLPVKDDRILPQQSNPAGEPVACVYSGEVLCLVRGPEG